ncbi:MAG TPA: hypothetical protein VJ732_10705 [Bryobacteraceae bacterium]|nr:hypothetical protein [Bryobacteraceae bacterium]
MKNRILVTAVLVAVAFLAGFLPQYVSAQRAAGQLRQARQQNTYAQLRDLAALSYVQAVQKNYGLAADTAARFFNRAREMANQAPADARQGFQNLLAPRDQITGELARGDPAVLGDLQNLFLKTRQATIAAGE